jgi:hypothetical protein
VRVLLDECVDWRLSRAISGHEVKTVAQMGWTGTKNGELLKRASAEFDVFVTIDQNLSFQQNARSSEIAVIVLHAKTSRLADMLNLVTALVAAIESAKPGTLRKIGE